MRVYGKQGPLWRVRNQFYLKYVLRSVEPRAQSMEIMKFIIGINFHSNWILGQHAERFQIIKQGNNPAILVLISQY